MDKLCRVVRGGRAQPLVDAFLQCINREERTSNVCAHDGGHGFSLRKHVVVSGKELVDLIGRQNRNAAFGVSKEQDIIARLVSEHVASWNVEGCRAPVSKCGQGPWRVDGL